MKKWLSLFLVFTMAAALGACLAEEPAPAEGGSGKVIFFEEKENGEELQQEIAASEPHAPEGLEKAVIGTDDRITVSNPSEWPYSAIALMDVTADCGCHWSGSGFLVGDTGLFLTAAHCLICTEHSEWANDITFYFGYQNSKNIYYTYAGDWQAYVGTRFYTGNYSIDKDYAVMKLDRQLPDMLGCFGAYWADNDPEIQSRYAYVAGYRDGKLRYDSGYLTVMDNDHVSYQMDQVPGNSGGPIYTSDGYAIGINIAERHDLAGNPLTNIGYRLTYELWQTADEYSRK